MSHKKTILYIITKSNWGGAQRYVYDLATSLPSDRYEVAVALGGDGALAVRLREAGIPVYPIHSLTRDVGIVREARVLRELIHLLRDVRPDILHVNSSKAGGLGSLAGRLSGVPRIVFTAHGWEFNAPRSLLSKLPIYFFSWLIIQFAHLTIAVSHATAAQISFLPRTKSRMRVVHLGLPHTTYTERKTAQNVLAQHSTLVGEWFAAGLPTVLTAAELHPVKGHRFAFEAIAHLKERGENIYYVLAGDGELRDELRLLVKKLDIADRVAFLGHIPHAAQYMHACDLFLIPSLSEAACYVALEAGAAQMPVVASSVGGIPETIEHRESGLLVAPGDSKGIAQALTMLLDDHTLRVRYGNALRQRVEQKFSLARMVEQTIALYEVSPSISRSASSRRTDRA